MVKQSMPTSKTSVLNNVDHQNLKIDTLRDAISNEEVNRCVVYTTEIGELHKEFPLVFYKHPDTGETQLHAILGLEKNENLFFNDRRWSSRFVPALLARGPFSLGYKKSLQGEEQHADPVICIDMNDPRVNTEQGENIFLQFGGEAPYLNHVKKALQTIERGLQFDKTLFTLVDSFDLLEPVSIQIQLSNVEEVNFSDYYTINQEKLAQLDGSSLNKLNQYGVLMLLYFMLSSTANFQQLIALKNAKSAMF